jgi:hypothetical protein
MVAAVAVQVAGGGAAAVQQHTPTGAQVFPFWQGSIPQTRAVVVDELHLGMSVDRYLACVDLFPFWQGSVPQARAVVLDELHLGMSVDRYLGWLSR